MKFKNALYLEKLPAYFLLATLVLSFYALLTILSPFLPVIFIAGVLAIAFYPLYNFLLRYLKNQTLASLSSLVAIILLIVVPLTFFILMLTSEGVGAYQVVREKIESGVFDRYLQWQDGAFFYDLTRDLSPVIDFENINLKEMIINTAQLVSTYLVSQTAGLVKGISSVVFNFVIMFFALFYFFRDGKKITQKFAEISPFPADHDQQLFDKLSSMVSAIVFGVFFTALAQGFVGGLGFAFVGISNPVFWGACMSFFSLIPMVGTVVVWLPAGLILLVLGDFWSGIFILLWGAFVVGLIDNFLRPYLIGGKAHTYPLLIFFVILGGIWTVGLQGIVLGPVVLMVFLSLLHIYQFEYGKILKS